jgi:glutamine amidotransferase
MREMWGRYWTMAHNGTLRGFAPRFNGRYRRYHPVGRTDSELAFCYLLETLRRLFPAGQPKLSELFRALSEVTVELSTFGEFNYLISNGEVLFAHCAKRLAYLVRRAPFTTAHLVDEDYSVDFSRLTTPADRVAVIATVPLTDNEVWTTMKPGELLLFHEGEPVASLS